MKIVDTAGNDSWKVTHVESAHCHFYFQETFVAHFVNGAFVGRWLLQGQITLLKPAAAAAVAKAMGDAQADAIAKARLASAGEGDCPVCLGSRVAIDDPSKACGACNGTGRKGS